MILEKKRIIMKVNEYINLDEADGFFILDSHKKDSEKHIYKDVDFVNYNYNKTRFNLLKENSLVLFRRPKRSGIDGKFYFYGGAFIEKLNINETTGEINASFKKSFKFIEPLFEDSKNAISFRKNKDPNRTDWGNNFWLVYGMNQITRMQYEILIKDIECEPVGTYSDASNNDILITSDENQEFDNTDMSDFEITLKETGDNTKTEQKPFKAKIGKHFDYDKLNKTKRITGKAGEVLVYNYEIEKLAGTPYKPEYVAETQGDGLGYDIKSFDKDGTEIYIEVKTTTSNKIDGFYLSENERSIAEEKKEQYKVYRVYNLNKKTKSANIQIFNNIISENFQLKPTTYRVFIK